ncbi:uncharacterized protein LOC143254905 [Tachypleus tridentatus]|uniref:uncharacterized protein LOC143254905 n=1 Tax=Tachypleus tridentatus TaxID=6853 RepID=UPI003FD67E93
MPDRYKDRKSEPADRQIDGKKKLSDKETYSKSDWPGLFGNLALLYAHEGTTVKVNYHLADDVLISASTILGAVILTSRELGFKESIQSVYQHQNGSSSLFDSAKTLTDEKLWTDSQCDFCVASLLHLSGDVYTYTAGKTKFPMRRLADWLSSPALSQDYNCHQINSNLDDLKRSGVTLASTKLQIRS